MGRRPFRLRIARLSMQVWLVVSALCAASCSDDDDYPYGGSVCRFDPAACAGGLGGVCRADVDCFGGVCCKSGDCGGGMCTLTCNQDFDCPPDMACEHGTCFFACRSDLDCARGQRCEHGHTVCEW